MMGKLKIDISNESFWVKKGSTRVRGGAYLNGGYLNSKLLAERVEDCDSREKIESLLSKLNGFFGLIKILDDRVLLAVDHVQSYPIYYSLSGNCISDSSNIAFSHSKVKSINKVRSIKYILSGFTGASKTVADDVHQVSPGSFTYLDKKSGKKLYNRAYFKYDPKNNKEFKYDQNDVDEIMMKSIERLMDSACGRKVALGLSGGVDSRIIALNVARLGYEDEVMAYTHKLPSGDSGDVYRARKLAVKFGFNHVVVDLTHEDFFDQFATKNISEIYSQTGWLDRVPQISQRILIDKIKDTRFSHENSLFTFGHHTLGAVAGPPYELRNKSFINKNEFIQMLYSNIYKYIDTQLFKRSKQVKTVVEKEILSSAGNLFGYSDWEAVEDAISVYEQMYWSDRLGRGCRDNSYASWMPFLDKEYIDYLENTPYEWRFGKKVQKEYAQWLNSKMGTQNIPMGTPKKQENSNSLASLSGKVRRKAGKMLSKLLRTVQKTTKIGRTKRAKKVYRSDARYGILPEVDFVKDEMHICDPPALIGLKLLERDQEYWGQGSPLLDII